MNILSADCYVGFLPVLQAIGGVLKEFIFAPRIDNLMNCYTGMQVHVVDSPNSFFVILYNKHRICIP